MDELTFEQLPKAVAEIITKVNNIEMLLLQILGRGGTGTMITPNEYLNMDEASKLLSLTKSTMYKLTHKRKIPHCKRGKYLYFSRQELNDWIKEGRIKTMQEIEIEANTYVVTHKRKY